MSRLAPFPLTSSHRAADPDRPLSVCGLSKSFASGARLHTAGNPRRTVHSLRNVSFDVERGSVFGLIGANGSGKSTLIRALSTLLVPDAGTVTVFGHDVEREPMAVRGLINRVSADPSFFGQMSALENLLFFGRIYGLSKREVPRRAAAILDRLGLDRRHQRSMVKELSRGQQQKIAVARAFLTSPVLLLLDEPTTGLDPRSKRDVQEFVREVQRDHDTTVLLTTHDMREVEALCDRVAFLVAGQLVADGSPGELRRSAGAADMDGVFMRLTGRSVEDDEDEVGGGDG